MPFRVISLDFDHTLTTRFSAIEHLALHLGIEKEIAVVEAEFKAGRLDILPNGTTFAAWYELIPPQASGGRKPAEGPQTRSVSEGHADNPKSKIENPKFIVSVPSAA